jgi:glucan biosynthesis protein
VPDQLTAIGKPLDMTYRVHWQGTEQKRPPGAWVTQTRIGRGYAELAEDEQQFVVDFTGPSLAALTADAEVMLEGIPRIVICTGRQYAAISERWTRHPHVRVLLKPMSLEAFEAAVRWLAGAANDSSWVSPQPSAD